MHPSDIPRGAHNQSVIRPGATGRSCAAGGGRLPQQKEHRMDGVSGVRADRPRSPKVERAPRSALAGTRPLGEPASACDGMPAGARPPINGQIGPACRPRSAAVRADAKGRELFRRYRRRGHGPRVARLGACDRRAGPWVERRSTPPSSVTPGGEHHQRNGAADRSKRK